MQDLDHDKAYDMERLITIRKSVFSHVMPIRISRALENSAFAQARTDLNYCFSNQSFLSIPAHMLEGLRSSLDTRAENHIFCVPFYAPLPKHTDTTIIARQQPPHRQSQAEKAISEAVRGLVDTSSESNFSFSDLKAAARRKAQLRADSIRIAEEQNHRTAQR